MLTDHPVHTFVSRFLQGIDTMCRDQLDQSMPVAAASNEQFKSAKEQGHGDDDFAAVYNAVSKKP